MGTSIIKINGVINTENPVLTNINKIADAGAAFFTWDIELGKWSVILNDPINTVSRAFDDSNIVGSITVGGTDLSETYNTATMRFPHKDLKDDEDFVTVSVPAGDRFLNEPDNELQMTSDLINDPVHAQYIASMELLQSRLEKIVQFTTDYSQLGVKAGEIVSLTSAQYAFNNKLFRVINVSEIDSEDGQLLIDITAQEYGDIWSTPLTRIDANKKTGIVPKVINDCIALKDKIDLSEIICDILTALPNPPTPLTTVFECDGQGNINHSVSTGSPCVQPVVTQVFYTVSGPSMVCENQTAIITIQGPPEIAYPSGSSVDYEISGQISPEDIGIPLTGTIPLTAGGTGTLAIPVTTFGGTEGDEEVTVLFKTNCGDYIHTFTIHDNYLSNPVYTVTPDKDSATECQSVTFTVCASNTDDGVAIPYTITGIQESDLDSGSLSGELVTNWCSQCATLTLDFAVDADVGTETIVFNLGNGLATATVPLYDDYAYTITWAPTEIIEGEIAVATITATGGIPDGTAVPYTITGTDTSKVSSPALEGTVTFTGGQATLEVQTVDDTEYDPLGDYITLSIGPAPDKHCTASKVLNILDNDAPPQGLACIYTAVPVVWCAQYEPDTFEVNAMNVRRVAFFMTSPEVGTAIDLPLTVTVSQGNPSTITVSETITVYTQGNGSSSGYVSSGGGSGMGGIDYNVITTFDAIGAGQPVTGVTQTVRGYDDV